MLQVSELSNPTRSIQTDGGSMGRSIGRRFLGGIIGTFLVWICSNPGVQAEESDSTPKVPAPHILVLGDSLAAGLGVDVSESWPGVLQSKFQTNGLPHQVINAGVSGDTTAGGVRRLNWLMRRPFDVLILELGGNDGLRGLPPSHTKTNLINIIQRTRDRWPETTILLAGMQMPDTMGADYAKEFMEIFPAVAKETNVTLIPEFLEGIAGDPELNQSDLIHPNAAGHRLLADRVWKVLSPLLIPK
jgi:acyl-CoA thioesterase-1